MPERLTTWTRLHGDRHFEKVRVGPYQAKDGRQLTVAYWRGSCVVCGSPYEVFTHLDPLAVINYPQSFEIVTCPAHRMTPSEAAALRYSKHGTRRQAFERIKAAKLGAR